MHDLITIAFFNTVLLVSHTELKDNWNSAAFKLVHSDGWKLHVARYGGDPQLRAIVVAYTEVHK